MTEDQLLYALETNQAAKNLWTKIIMRLGRNSLCRLVTDDEKYIAWVSDMDTFRKAVRNLESDANENF